MIKGTAKYFETFDGYDYFRDKFGNVYMQYEKGGEIYYCSNLKKGNLTEDKAEPSYPVDDIELVY